MTNSEQWDYIINSYSDKLKTVSAPWFDFDKSVTSPFYSRFSFIPVFKKCLNDDESFKNGLFNDFFLTTLRSLCKSDSSVAYTNFLSDFFTQLNEEKSRLKNSQYVSIEKMEFMRNFIFSIELNQGILDTAPGLIGIWRMNSLELGVKSHEVDIKGFSKYIDFIKSLGDERLSEAREKKSIEIITTYLYEIAKRDNQEKQKNFFVSVFNELSNDLIIEINNELKKPFDARYDLIREPANNAMNGILALREIASNQPVNELISQTKGTKKSKPRI